MPRIVEQLCDLGEGRIAEMDAAGIDMQVLSLISPGTEQLDAADAAALAREANDFLAAAVRQHPDRFAGFATLPTAAPDAAADELERLVREHGFKGAQINGHIGGRYLDDEFFWPILERAEALHAPIYLHPTPPPPPVIEALYTGNFSPEVTACSPMPPGAGTSRRPSMSSASSSAAPSTASPLQLIIGHLGEALPFMLPRLDRTLPAQVTKLKRPISAYLRENVYYTFSGFNYLPTFLDLLLQVGVERIMFSADYPFSPMTPRAPSWSSSRCAPPIKTVSPTATRNACCVCDRS